MRIDDSTVDKIASLSKLEFTGKQKELIKNDMNNMLDFIGKLGEVDTEGVEPLIHMTQDVNVLRKDNVVSDISQEEALRNAPKKDSTYIKIPKVVTK